jgi:hypothetical protein
VPPRDATKDVQDETRRTRPEVSRSIPGVASGGCAHRGTLGEAATWTAEADKAPVF